MASLSVLSPHITQHFSPSGCPMPLGLFKECIMPIFSYSSQLSLISFGIIKRSEFYEHQITAKQIFSPIHCRIDRTKECYGGICANYTVYLP